MKKKLYLGKCDYNNTGKKNCLATVEWELNAGRFSMSGNIWNPRQTDIYCGGQCLDTLLEYFPNHKYLPRMVEIWREYHLNDMTAGSPAQEAYLKTLPENAYKDAESAYYKAKKEEGGYYNSYSHYEWASELLEKAGLNPDPNYLHEEKPYKYGSAWLKTEIPFSVIQEIESWPETLNYTIDKETKEKKPIKDAFTQWLESRYDFNAEFVEECERGDYYKCTFTTKAGKYDAQGKAIKQRKMVADFYQGIAHRINNMGKKWNEREARADYSMRHQVNRKKSAPDIKKVMDCLINDAHAYDNNRDVADFVMEYGYDDFKKGRRVWQACEKQYNDLQQFAGPDFRDLMNGDELPESEAA